MSTIVGIMELCRLADGYSNVQVLNDTYITCILAVSCRLAVPSKIWPCSSAPPLSCLSMVGYEIWYFPDCIVTESTLAQSVPNVGTVEAGNTSRATAIRQMKK